MLALACPLLLPAPINGVLRISTPGKLVARRGRTVVATLQVRLRPGYHVNSHQPTGDYIIPLKLTWEAGPLQVVRITYPEPRMEHYQFSRKPLSVFTGDFVIRTHFRVPGAAPLGERTIGGKLRYQACNDRLCLPPRTVTVRLPVEIR